jgi:hypothetical protein
VEEWDGVILLVRTDQHAGDVEETPVSPKDVLATAFYLLGIDPESTFPRFRWPSATDYRHGLFSSGAAWIKGVVVPLVLLAIKRCSSDESAAAKIQRL